VLAELRGELYEKLAHAANVTEFQVLGVQILDDHDTVCTIGESSHQARTTSSRLLGSLAGAEAMISDGSQARSPNGAMLPPDTLARIAKTTRSAAVLLFPNGVVSTHRLDSDGQVFEAQGQVAQFNALAAADVTRTGHDMASRWRLRERLDKYGEVRKALDAVVADGGWRVLSDPRMLSTLMLDLLPDLAKERELLALAAEADVAGELRRYIEELHLGAGTAVQLAARGLADRKTIEPELSIWVATEYARVLGYPVRRGAMPRSAAPRDLKGPGLPAGDVTEDLTEEARAAGLLNGAESDAKPTGIGVEQTSRRANGIGQRAEHH
jgi:hypothetical protein